MTTTTWLVLLIAGWLAAGVMIAMVLGSAAAELARCSDVPVLLS